jgi:type I restriction enzyme S subunit
MSELTHFTVEDIALEMGDAPFGSNLKNIHYTDSGALVVQGKNVQGRSFNWNDKRHVSFEKHESIPRSHCYPGDLIFPKVGTIGKVGILSPCDGYDKYILSTNTMRLKVNPEKANPLFIYYYFTWSRTVNLIHAMNSKSVQAVFNFTTLKKFPLELPNLEVQNEAGRIIGKLDNKIELNRQTNQTLEQMAQAIFKSWFVDFEPTRAKIAAKLNGQDPERAAMAAVSGKSIAELDQLSPDTQQQLHTTAALVPDKVVDSELGEIPEGWEVKSLSSVIKLTGGGTPKRSEQVFWNGDIPWFSIKDIPGASDVFVVDTVEKISQVGLSKSSTKLLPKGTTIISARGTVGKLALVATPMCMNQSCYGINGVEGIGPYFNYFNLREAISTLQRNTHGAVFDTITTQTFESYSMAIRIDELTKAFEVLVTPLMDRIENNVRESRNFSELRDSLLPKLLSGELAISSDA